MAAQASGKNPVSKGHLIALGLSVLVLIVSPGGRKQISKIIKLPNFKQSTSRTAILPQTGRGAEDINAVRRDVEAFNEWLLNEAQVASIRVEHRRDTPVVQTPVSGERSIWRVPISGVALQDGDLEVLLQQHRLRVGDVIPPTERRCGYQLLSVSRRSVWFVAFDEEPPGFMEGLRLSDIQSIHLTMDASAAPHEVELRPGIMAKIGDTILFDDSGARMYIRNLWRNAVHFQYETADQAGVLDLLCVILR